LNKFVRNLRKSGIPTDAASYENLHHFDTGNHEPVFNPPESEGKKRQTAEKDVGIDEKANKEKDEEE
jgi:hypothetical protein